MAVPAIDPLFLSLLRCPVSGQPLRLGEWREVGMGNPDRELEAVLITADGQWFYPIIGGILHLLPEHQREAFR